jgi:hypothetical protein
MSLNRLSTSSRAAALLGLAGIAAGIAQPVDAGPTSIGLAPHRAVYDMKLERTNASAGISALTGRMVFELKGSACSGYEQTMRFVTETLDQSGKPAMTDQRSVFKEEAGTGRFSFKTRQYRNDRLTETTIGTAARGGDPARLDIQIEKPKTKRIRIKEPVLFPVEHSIRLLEAAHSGKSMFAVNLYDGSDKGEKIYNTTAALGPRKPAGVNRGLGGEGVASSLDDLAAWPVSLSYFEIDGKRRDAVPSYELSFLYFENGVSRKLFIDYGTFSMSGRLIKLTMLPVENCRK